MPTRKTPPKTVVDRCSFCHRPSKDVGRLASSEESPGASVCKNCAERIVELLNKTQGTPQEPPKRRSKVAIGDVLIPPPKLFYNHLNRYVVGQDRAKRRLSVGVTNHMKRLLDLDLTRDNKFLIEDPDVSKTVIDKSNILLLGPTGTGKTLLARSLAEYLGVPFAIGDATTLTEAGYVGEDVENLLLKLIHAADFDIPTAERGVIYIDEIDKIHRTGHNVSITRDVSGEGVQQSLLKMIEGTIASVPPQGGRKHPEQQYVQINTTNILFICGGAFVGIEDIIARRIGKSAIGFGRTMESSNSVVKDRNALLRQVEPQDLIDYGLIPELIGRLPVVATLDDLSVEDLVRVFQEPENALLKQYRKLCLMEGVDLHFTEGAVTLLAEKAKAKGLGARALKSIVEDVMTEVMFSLSDFQNGKLIITPEVILGEASPHLEVKEAA